MSADSRQPSVPRRSPWLDAEDEVDLVIEKLVAGGEGLARWRGLPIFVARSAPGDRLRVRFTERRSDYGRAEILEILSPGAGRREPPCRHFGVCGGCDLQHIDDDLQTELKVSALQETLSRLGGVGEGIEIKVLKGEPWAYRQRTQVHTESGDRNLRIGYRARRAHELVEVEECPVLVPELEGLLLDLPSVLAPGAPRRIDLLAGDRGELSTAPTTPHLPHGEVTVTAAEWRYQLDARCFFQTHRNLSSLLIAEVVGEWRGKLAVDLYAGVGLFSVPLAKHFERVVAVEVDRVAGRYLQRNGRQNRVENLEYRHSAVESWISELPSQCDRIVVDPPRRGLARIVRQALRDRSPGRLTYVSCHPAALARDLRSLSDRFSIESITMLDMFPQTGHMEVVVQLVA